MKRVWMYMVGALGLSMFMAGGRVFADGTDGRGAATTAASTASTNATALLVALIAIPVAFLAFKVVKRCLGRA